MNEGAQYTVKKNPIPYMSHQKKSNTDIVPPFSYSKVSTVISWLV